MSELLKMDLSGTLRLSFLTAYPYIMINENGDMYEKCMAYMVEHSGASIQQNLKFDSRVGVLFFL